VAGLVSVEEEIYQPANREYHQLSIFLILDKKTICRSLEKPFSKINHNLPRLMILKLTRKVIFRPQFCPFG